MEEVKELQKELKGLRKEKVEQDKLLETVNSRRSKHETRIATINDELQAAERRLAETIERIARDEAGEKDLDHVQAQIDSLKSKQRNLGSILAAFEREVAPTIQEQEATLVAIRKVESKIAALVSSQMIQDLSEKITDVFAVYGARYKYSGISVVFPPFLSDVLSKIPNRKIERYDRDRGAELLAPYLK